ncbi:hypothetical protein CHS0354_013663 [Potamilus streckersoni]|uniref:Uncharacterized protein n=1 Tax=Potamilus streckersoni TaxID=2493646 RepID=A0AAE0W1Y2_9BIVA|nr:hypothetical protein CHS0354_013663 [Potamilus streckersoni]
MPNELCNKRAERSGNSNSAPVWRVLFSGQEHGTATRSPPLAESNQLFGIVTKPSTKYDWSKYMSQAVGRIGGGVVCRAVETQTESTIPQKNG